MCHEAPPPPNGAAETRNESEPIQRRNQEGGDVDVRAVTTKRHGCSAHGEDTTASTTKRMAL